MKTGGSSKYWPSSVVPADLVVVVAVVVLANLAVFHSALNSSPVRVVTGLFFVLFVPGYALVAALFPEEGRPPEEMRTGTDDGSESSGRTWGRGLGEYSRSIDRWGRLALSFALSLAVVPLLALGVTLSPFSFTTMAVFLTISSFTVLCAVIATGRRLARPPKRRFSVSAVAWLGRKRRSLREIDSRGELLLTVGLSLAIVFAVGTFGFAILSPPDGETYTDFYVLSEAEDGELVAADYPDSFTVEEPQQVHTGIENYEKRTVEYHVVVQLQRVEGSGQDAVVTERTEIDRFSMTLAHNETRVTERSLTVPERWTGTDLRLKFLMYEDSPPETLSSDTAYRDLHLWIDVQEPTQNATAAE